MLLNVMKVTFYLNLSVFSFRQLAATSVTYSNLKIQCRLKNLVYEEIPLTFALLNIYARGCAFS
jgi:hypothetical protein